jgi:hypothetical protein
MMLDALWSQIMRTTLAIDDDVLVAAKAMAEQQNRSLGDVISDLARKSLRRPQPRTRRNGILLLGVKPGGSVVTADIVNRLRDELP